MKLQYYLFNYTVLYLCVQGPIGPIGSKGDKGERGEPVEGPKGFKVHTSSYYYVFYYIRHHMTSHDLGSEGTAWTARHWFRGFSLTPW